MRSFSASPTALKISVDVLAPGLDLGDQVDVRPVTSLLREGHVVGVGGPPLGVGGVEPGDVAGATVGQVAAVLGQAPELTADDSRVGGCALRELLHGPLGGARREERQEREGGEGTRDHWETPMAMAAKPSVLTSRSAISAGLSPAW